MGASHFLIFFTVIFACFANSLPARALTYGCYSKNLQSIIPPPESDPYDPISRMPMGEWKGQVIDTHIKRPAQIISEDGKKIVFANFLDGSEFHQAEVPLDGIENVYFRINRFSSGVKGVTPAHTLLYFKMKPGSEIVLGSAKNGADFSNPTRVSEFIFSLDYTGPAGVKYNLLKSAKPNYLSVMDFRSAKDYALRGEDPNHPVEYLKLNLDDGEKSKLLQASIHRSQERGLDRAYNLASYNCTNELFNLLDDVLKYPLGAKRFVTTIPKSGDLTAGPAEKALLERGLIRENADGKVPAIMAKPDGMLPKEN